MASHDFPPLIPDSIAETRQALHAYSRVVGSWCKAARLRRKHWWNASLRPSLSGLTTGVIYANRRFEIELDLVESCIHVHTASSTVSQGLSGQSGAEVLVFVRSALSAAGVDKSLAPAAETATPATFPEYSEHQAELMQAAIASITSELEDFRAGIREETSPIQLWPHHFDLSMIWLPGPKLPDQDPDDEELADKQMGFGFAFGDDTIPEPYFYVTAYPLPDNLPGTSLPGGTTWKSDGFCGAVLLYGDLAAMQNPAACLQDLWSTLLEAGVAGLNNPD